MKRLLLLICLLPIIVQAQFTNQTVRKTISGGALTLSPSGDSLYTRPQVRALINAVPASGNINNYKVAYVDTLGNNGTAILGRPDKPFATITAALASLPTSGGKIKLGIGSFVSPSGYISQSNLIIEGSGMPDVNGSTSVETLNDEHITMTAPTKLVGGTILKGSLRFRGVNNIKVLNLGTDVGTAYVAGGGTVGDGLTFTLTTSGNLSATVPFMAMHGIEVRNFTTLNTNAGELVHGVLVENTYEPVLDNIHTYYAVHGIAVKSIGGTLNNIFTHGHGFNGIIIKSDNYAYSSQVSLTNFRVSSIASNDGGGINIQTEGGIHNYIKISNGTIYGTKFGIYSVNNMPTNIDIDNASIINTIGYGFFVSSGGSFIKISNSLAKGNLYDGFYVNSAASYSLLSNNSSISNGGDGFELSSTTRVDFDNILSINNTGYGIRSGSSVYGGTRTITGNTLGGVLGSIGDRINSFTNLTLNGTTGVAGPALGDGLTWTDNVNNTGHLAIRSGGVAIGADNDLNFETAATSRGRFTTAGKFIVNDLGGTGDRITYVNSSGQFQAAAIGSGLSLSGGTLTATGGSSGSVTTTGGTAGFIPKFTGSSAIANSSIQDNGAGLVSVAGSFVSTGSSAGIFWEPRAGGTAGGWYTIGGAAKFNSGAADLLSITLSSGAVALTGALTGTSATFSGDVTANSDSTLKKNIRRLLNVSPSLRVIASYLYDWKATDAHSLGLIAQEIQPYYPELVKTDEKGILSVNYQNFTSVLLQGWKELDERITKLEQK